ncbi:MAG: 3-deoxy-7-phosphoheptulonate synthase class II [Phycisphaerales bacterium]
MTRVTNTTSDAAAPHPGAQGWSPDSWKTKLAAQQVRYTDREAVERAVRKLAAFPPLVTSGEIEHLRELVASAQRGERFWLQGGDCAESLDECRPESIASKLKILLQMSLVLVHGMKKPVIRVGRFAGQYAKPRSSATEVIDGVELPSYFGDLVNRPEPTVDARTPDPHLMVRGYQHAAVTLNFIRSLIDGGFADLHHPEHWDLGFLDHAGLKPESRERYRRMADELADALTFMEALGDRSVDEMGRVDFFTSHEALNLLYESAQTRSVPRREGYYNLTTHFPWIGERTRALDGAHVEYARGIRNPVGVKIGPQTTPEELVATIDALNPGNEAGKLVLITRLGAKHAEEAGPRLIEAVAGADRRVLWISDPMHGNTRSTESGVKTRSFEDILTELEIFIDAHRRAGTYLGGVHFELTGEDVTECTGGAMGLDDEGLGARYLSPCDPRLNYAQALEMAFTLAERMR